MSSTIDYNTVREKPVPVYVSHPASPQQFDPVRFGEITGIALENEGVNVPNAALTQVYFGPCTGNFSVEGLDDIGGVSISPGDAIYYTDGGGIHLNRKTSGVIFGVALSSVASAAVATIPVYKLSAHVQA